MTVRAETQIDLSRVDDGSQGADGTTFTPSVNAAGDISWTNDGGKTNPPTQNIKGPEGDEGPAGKTAYESAVDGGYTGTEAEFNSDLSQVSDVTQHFWYDNDGAHVAEVDQDTFTQNPQGANTLIDSNGLSMRDGTTTLASFSAGGATIGQDDGARTEVTSFGVDLYDEKGIPAISIKSSGAQGTVWKTTSYNITRKNGAGSLNSITDDCIAGAKYYITHGTGTRTEFTQGTSKTISTTAYNKTTETNIPITLTASADGAGNITVTTSATGSVTGSITVSYKVEYPVLADMASIELSGNISVKGTTVSDGSWALETRKSLWTNSSPTSSFTAKTVLSNDADLAECDAVEIYYRHSTTDDRVYCVTGDVGTKVPLTVQGMEYNRTGGRIATVNSNGITFGAASYNTNSNNTYAIPTKIVGIKYI